MPSTPASMPLTFFSLAESRSRRLRIPAVAVYFACDVRANSMAASTMCSGVRKDGSPTSSRMQPGVTRARLTTSRMPEWAASAGPAEIAGSCRVAVFPLLAAGVRGVSFQAACHTLDSSRTDCQVNDRLLAEGRDSCS